MIEIKSVTGRVLYSCEAADVRAALIEAVRRGVDLAGADLTRTNLSGVNLARADLTCADLFSVDLTCADLFSVDLTCADLSSVDLARANLSSATLIGANLTGANLYRANLYRADLTGADLARANLSSATLIGANLTRANLYRVDLAHANLDGANLDGARHADLAIARTRILPDDGDVIGWKQCRDNRIVKLRVPDGVARSHGSGRKCRAAKAEVLAIFDHNGNPVDTAASQHDPGFVYRVGETVTPTEPFDTNPWDECAPGIHFYITRAEAEAHP